MTDDDFAAYSKINAVNWSTLKEMRKSPKHYQHALTHPREDTPAMALGRATHTAVFEPDRFALEYAVWKGERRAGKDWEAFKAAHESETILRIDDYKRAIAIRDAVRSHPVASRYLVDGHAEQTITWRDEETGIACKARLDWHRKSPRVLVDLKTANDIEKRKFGQAAARLGYHGQIAFYSDGLASSMRSQLDEVVIIAAESDAPYDVAVFRIDADVLYAGRELYRDLLCRVAGCFELGAWPGRYNERESLELPEWAFGDDDDNEGLTSSVVEQEAAHG